MSDGRNRGNVMKIATAESSTGDEEPSRSGLPVCVAGVSLW